jgi:hypothetical protein
MDPIVIQLRSVTVFWEDINLPKRPSDHQRARLAVWWDDTVEPWLLQSIKGHVNPHLDGVWFADPHDAAKFKIKFSGDVPDLQ